MRLSLKNEIDIRGFVITQKLREKSASIAHSRWTAYATAGAATAFGCAATTEDAFGSIHYSGPINQFFSSNSAHFQLDQPGDSVKPDHIGGAFGSGAAIFYMYGIDAGSLAGFTVSRYQYASKLGSGVNLNGQANWVAAFGDMAVRSGFPNSQWLQPGTGFVGFRFDGGNGGFQYGWARITIDGAPENTFTLIDFAWGDVDDTVITGQVPEPGSLGLLAIGSVGLVAWRMRRSQA